MPSPDDNETSCYRTTGLRASQIWRLGRSNVNERLYGRAEIVASDITSVGRLTLRPDDSPPRHVSIANWSTDEAERISWAQVLAERATLHLVTD
jgi:hypothetical protein